MFSSGILDLLIGLALLYFLLATLCLALQELMAGLFATRAKVLVAALQNMLQDPHCDLLKEFLGHPSVRAISGPELGRTRLLSRLRGTGAGRPSYLAAGTFSEVVIDLLLSRRASGAKEPGASMTGAKGPGPSGPSVLLALAAPGEDRVTAGFALLENLHASVGVLPDSGPKHALVMALNESRGDIDRAKAGIEAWFNGTMDRASGWYKRHTQCWVLVYALLLTVALNGDSIMVANALSADEATRKAVADFAVTYVQKPSAVAGPGADNGSIETTPSHRVTEMLDLTRQSHLTLGWVLRKPGDEPGVSDPRHIPTTTSGVWSKILGLLVTMLAVSLGAPFWFDLLNRFVNLRSTGKPPNPKQAEPPPTPAPPPFEKTPAKPDAPA